MQFLDFFSEPKVMGIVNLTPDSFYDGNQYTTEKTILKRVENILKEGGDIIDLGAFSSRPGADFVSYKEEHRRLMQPLKSIISSIFQKRFCLLILTVPVLLVKLWGKVLPLSTIFQPEI